MKKKYLKIIIIILFLIFSCSYYISYSGYYEYSMQQRTILTNEKIKEFEEDIKNNKDISIKDYYQENVNYTNRATNFVYNLTDNGNKIIRKCFSAFFKKISGLIQD